MRRRSLKSVFILALTLMFILQTAFAAAMPALINPLESGKEKLTDNTSMVSDEEGESFMFDEDGNLIKLDDDFDYDAVTAEYTEEGAGVPVDSDEAVLANTSDYTRGDAGVIYFENFEKYSVGEAEGVVDNFRRVPYPDDTTGYQTETNAKIVSGISGNSSNALAVNIPSSADSKADKNTDFTLSFLGDGEYESVIENGVLEVSFRAKAANGTSGDVGIVSFSGKSQNDTTTQYPGIETTNYTFKSSGSTFYGYNLSGQTKTATLNKKWDEWHKYTSVIMVENGLVTGVDHFVDNVPVQKAALPSKSNSPAPGLLKIRPTRSNVGSTVYIDDVTVVGYDKKFDDIFDSLNIPNECSSSFELPNAVGDVTILYSVDSNPYVTAENGKINVTAPARGDSEVKIYASMTYNNGGTYPVKGVREKTIKLLKSTEANALVNELAREDLTALEITSINANNISANFTLPTKGIINGSDISWKSNGEWISFDADGNATVTIPPYTGQIGRSFSITASVKNQNSEVYTKNFDVRVLEAPPATDQEKVQYERSNLKFNIDLTDVRSNINLPSATYAKVEWESDNKAIEILNEGGVMTGKVTTPVNGEVVVHLTAIIKSGNVSAQKEFDVTVKSNNVVKAFPGAEGYGAYSKGGRGGYVYHVTNLSSDPGTKGSLAYGMETLSGARTIVFDVAGTIDLTDKGKEIKLSGEKGSNVTIAGQTAPYPGIQLKGFGITMSNVHDVVVRHIRIRIGNVQDDGYLEQMDPLSAGSVKNTIIDHCSFAWHVDMGFRVTGENVTMSNSILSKGLNANSPHDKGGGHNYAGAFGTRKASFIKNYVSDSEQRSPRLVDDEYVDVYNNLLYNCNHGFDVTNYEWMGVNILESVHDNFAQDGPTRGNDKGKFIRINRGRDYAGGVMLYGANNYSTVDNSDTVTNIIDKEGEFTNYLKSYRVESDGFDGSSILYTLRFGEDNKTLINGKASGYSDDYDLSNVTFNEWNSNPLSYDNNNKSAKGATLTFMPYPFPAPRGNLVNSPDDDPSTAAAKIFEHVTSNAGATKPARDIEDLRLMAEAASKTKGNASLSKDVIYKYCDEMNIRTQYDNVFNPETNRYDSVKRNVYDYDETVAMLLNPEKPEGYENRWSDRAKDYAENGDNKGTPNGYVDGRSTNNLQPTIYKDAGDKITWNIGTGDGPLIVGTGTEATGGTATPIAITWDDSWWEEYVGFPMNGDMIYHTNADIPEEYRTAEQNAHLGDIIVWDSQEDGIPDWYKDIKGWDKTRAINNVYLENGYSCLEDYLAFMAGDEEFDAVTNNKGTVAENFNVNNIGYCTGQPYWNTDYRAKCTIYYGTKSCSDVNDYDRSELVVHSSKTDGYHTYHSIVLADLEADTTYYYRVSAVDEFGMERISEEQSFKTTPMPGSIVPEPPVVQIARPYLNQVYLKWSGNVQTDEAYRVRYGTSPGNYPNSSDVFDRKTYDTTITGLENGVRYYFVVEAINEKGSTFSEEVHSTPSNSLVYYDYTQMTPEEQKAYLSEIFIYNLGGTVLFKNKEIAGGKPVLEYHDNTQSHGVNSWINFPVNQDETFTTEVRLILERHKPTYGTNEHATFQLNFFMDNEVDDSGSSLDSRDFTTVFSVIFDQGDIKLGSDPLAQYNTIAVPYTSTNSTALVESNDFNNIVKTPLTMEDLESGRIEWIDLKVVTDCENNLITVYVNDREVGSGTFNEDVDGPYNVGRLEFKTRLDGNLVADVASLNIYSGTTASSGISDNMNNLPNLVGTTSIPNVPIGIGSGNNKPSSGGNGGGGGGAGGSGAGGSQGTGNDANDGNGSGTETGSDNTNTSVNPGSESSSAAVTFNDLSSVSWAEAAIKELAKEGIVNGVGSNQFAPLSEVTRAEFITMLMRAFEKDTQVSGGAKFSDVPDGEWYSESVSKAAALGVVNGMDDGRFGVNELITRQDMMVMSYRLLTQKGIELSSVRDGVQFSDASEISDYAASALDNMYKAGIINGVGDNMLNPKGLANRAEAAKILYELKSVTKTEAE